LPPGTVVVFNPQAGKIARKGKAWLENLARSLAGSERLIRLEATRGPGTAGGIARASVAAGAGLVVAAGGDGTVNEVLQGMIGSHVPLGVIPAGTANVLMTEMGAGSAARAAGELSGWMPRRIAVGRLRSTAGERYFLLMAGIGLDAHVVYHLSARLKSRFGKLAYWRSALGMLGRELEEFEVLSQGRLFRCSFALASRVRNYGGDLQIASAATLFDDRFEVVLFEGKSSLRYLRYFAGVAARRLSGMEGVSVFRAQSLEAAAADRRVYVQVDGEFAGCLPASIEIVPDALTLLVPPEYVRRCGER